MENNYDRMNTDNTSDGKISETDKKIYSRKEVALYLGISLATVDRAIANRDIGFCRVGARVLFQEFHIQEYLNRDVSLAKPKRAPRGLLALAR